MPLRHLRRRVRPAIAHGGSPSSSSMLRTGRSDPTVGGNDLLGVFTSMSVRSKSILITGGAGFIGSHLVDRLIKDEPRRITVVDNFFLGSLDNLAQARAARDDIDIIRLDAADLAAMQDVVTSHEIDTVFDLAVIPLPTSLTYPAWTVQTNVGIATTFCEIARRGLVERLIHLSSSEPTALPATSRWMRPPARRHHALRGEQVRGRSHHRVVRADVRDRRDRDPPVQQHRAAPEPPARTPASCRSSSPCAGRPADRDLRRRRADPRLHLREGQRRPHRPGARLTRVPRTGPERRDRRRDLRQRADRPHPRADGPSRSPPSSTRRSVRATCAATSRTCRSSSRCSGISRPPA